MNAHIATSKHDLDIGIGGLWVRLHTDSPEFIAELTGRFAGFLGQADHPDHIFDIELAPFPDIDNADGGVDAHEDGVHVTRDGPLWLVRRGDFFAQWDPKLRRGHARMVPSPYSLDSVIRILHTLILAEQGGMLMHASCVALGGRAWVFTGVSGAGKTTISRLSPPDAHILTDEMSFLRPEAGVYHAHGTPFSGDLGRPGENLRAPLAGVFLLAQGKDNVIETLSKTEAVRVLMSNILYFAQDDVLTAKVFDNAIALAERVPVRRLTFAPDARVWDLIGYQP